MGKSSGDHRERIVQEAARIICEHGVRDYRLAKEKAAHQVGVRAGSGMPSNSEIQVAVKSYLELFFGATYQDGLLKKRRLASVFMQACDDFQPRLVGGVLDGTSAPSHPVQIHIFGDSVEEFDRYLLEHSIPYDIADKRFRYGVKNYQYVAVCEFTLDDVDFEVAMFPYDGLRRAPDCPVTGHPMQRLALAQLKKRFDTSAEPPV